MRYRRSRRVIRARRVRRGSRRYRRGSGVQRIGWRM